MVQGIGVGGEWGGSVLLAMEWSRHHGHRGLVASWPQFGVPCGLFLASLVILAVSYWSGDQFATWGWARTVCAVDHPRRRRAMDPPWRGGDAGVSAIQAKNRIERAPVLEVFKKQPREIVLSALVRMSEQAPFYIFTAFIFAYAVGTLHMSRDLILTAVLVASCVSFITIPLSGHMSDRIGRRKMYMIGAAATGVIGFPYFAMVDESDPLGRIRCNRGLAYSARHAIRAATNC